MSAARQQTILLEAPVSMGAARFGVSVSDVVRQRIPPRGSTVHRMVSAPLLCCALEA
jgi:hypothetical protein